MTDPSKIIEQNLAVSRYLTEKASGIGSMTLGWGGSDMSKYTEGPWTVEVESLRGGRYYSVIRPGDTEPIDIHEEDNGEADARLIAAAPDMLEALRPFAEVDYEELIGAPDDMPIEEALRKAGQPTVGDLRRAMDAVDKAEGRS